MQQAVGTKPDLTQGSCPRTSTPPSTPILVGNAAENMKMGQITCFHPKKSLLRFKAILAK